MNCGLRLVDVGWSLDMVGDDGALYGWAPMDELSLSKTTLADMHDKAGTMNLDDPMPMVGLEIEGLGPRCSCPVFNQRWP